jgi:GNAT superfamily N-acetyltransferase
MKIEVTEEPITLEEYATIPIKFEVTKVFDVTDRNNSPGEFVLTERNLDVPYVKDYDAIDGEHPTEWPARFDISNWGILAARTEGRRVGGAVVAFNTPGLDMLEGREDLAVLWDIRVLPEARGQGIGSALFRAAKLWSIERGCNQQVAETQNINVPACRFYVRQGCVLKVVRRSAYPRLPNEVQLIWHCALSRDGT